MAAPVREGPLRLTVEHPAASSNEMRSAANHWPQVQAISGMATTHTIQVVDAGTRVARAEVEHFSSQPDPGGWIAEPFVSIDRDSSARTLLACWAPVERADPGGDRSAHSAIYLLIRADGARLSHPAAPVNSSTASDSE